MGPKVGLELVLKRKSSFLTSVADRTLTSYKWLCLYGKLVFDINDISRDRT